MLWLRRGSLGLIGFACRGHRGSWVLFAALSSAFLSSSHGEASLSQVKFSLVFVFFFFGYGVDFWMDADCGGVGWPWVWACC